MSKDMKYIFKCECGGDIFVGIDFGLKDFIMTMACKKCGLVFGRTADMEITQENPKENPFCVVRKKAIE